MINLSHDEALLFRVLTGFFGRERVIPHMSLMSVCGGSLPENISLPETGLPGEGAAGDGLAEWARRNKCLFTVVDGADNPKMVIEFFSGFEQSVDVMEEQHQRIMKPVLAAAGVRYITISGEEFSEIIDPGSSLDFFSFLKDRVESPEKLY